MRTWFAGLALVLCPSIAWGGEPEPVWVFFTDRGRSDEQVRVELEQRSAELGPRTLARRAKVRSGALVDAGDLLPAEHYVHAVERSGARLRVRSRWLNAISVEADAATQRELAELPFVRELRPFAAAHPSPPNEPNELTPVPLPANMDEYGISWPQLDMIGVPALHDCGLTGAGVVVGVQDTGFVLDHAALADIEVLAAYDFVNQDDNVGIEPGDAELQHHHGTEMLSLLAGMQPNVYRGVAPGVAVILSKTEDYADEQPIEEDYYVAGLEWIEGMGADIMTASLGYKAWYAFDDLDGATAVTSIAVEMATRQGLIIFVSMGNWGPEPGSLSAPADAAGAISLGSVDLEGLLADTSGRGPTADGRIKPDIVAPGRNAIAISPVSTTEYVLLDGTSVATPLAAGMGALLLEADPTLTPATMAELLRSTASQADMPDSNMGHGLVDGLALAQILCSCADADADGYLDAACGGDDCDDANADVHPGALEQCSNERDDDCDMAIDADDSECSVSESESGSVESEGEGDSTTGTASGDEVGSESGSESDSVGSDEASGCACAVGASGRSGAPLLLLLGLVRVRARRRAA